MAEIAESRLHRIAEIARHSFAVGVLDFGVVREVEDDAELIRCL
jgi:hypothetical protein